MNRRSCSRRQVQHCLPTETNDTARRQSALAARISEAKSRFIPISIADVVFLADTAKQI